MKPVRLCLSRRKGFDMQALSRSINGLEAVEVTRPSVLGNPFSILPKHEPGKVFHGARAFLAGDLAFGGYIAVPTAADAVACFREMMTMPGERPDAIRARLPQLRGKNLGCFCAGGSPCHADVLLELANAPICEEV